MDILIYMHIYLLFYMMYDVLHNILILQNHLIYLMPLLVVHILMYIHLHALYVTLIVVKISKKKKSQTSYWYIIRIYASAMHVTKNVDLNFFARKSVFHISLESFQPLKGLRPFRG